MKTRQRLGGRGRPEVNWLADMFNNNDNDNGGNRSGSGGESDRSAAPVARSPSLPPPAYGFEFHDLDGLPWFACWANGANPSAGRASGMLHVPSPRVRDETCVRAHRTH